jgi:hypothetical protein
LTFFLFFLFFFLPLALDLTFSFFFLLHLGGVAADEGVGAVAGRPDARVAAGPAIGDVAVGAAAGRGSDPLHKKGLTPRVFAPDVAAL